MSNGNFQHESDDELLSAYLDGELAEAERAAVDARLANDPGAQQMLHQLRSVSQAVQRLPPEAVGRDLSETILRRAEALKPATAASATLPASGVSLPKLTIFQTRRSWVWASLAVAAGLMIMVFQQGDPNSKKLPAVAQNDAKPSTKRESMERLGQLADRSVRDSSVDPKQVVASDEAQLSTSNSAPVTTAAPPRPEPVLEMPAATEFAAANKTSVDQLAIQGEGAARGSLSRAETAPMRSDLPTDGETQMGRIAQSGAAPSPANRSGIEFAPEPAPPSPATPLAAADKPIALGVEARGGFAGGKAGQPAPADAAAAGRATSGFAIPLDDARDKRKGLDEERRPQLVVHVVAKADSFRQKSFDKLLANCGVVLEPQQQAADEKRASGGGRGGGAADDVSRLYAKSPIRPSGGKADFDLVLVDAPQATIASCLTDLKNDSVNFVSLEVDEPGAAKDSRDRAKVSGALNKKLDADFGKFNRGVVSQQQKLAFEHYYSYGDVAAKEPWKAETEGADRYAAAEREKPPVETAKETAPGTRSADVQARARRLSTLELERKQQLEESVSKSGEAVAPAAAPSRGMRRADASLKASDGAAPMANLQVLFIISPELPVASSAPAEKAAK